MRLSDIGNSGIDRLRCLLASLFPRCQILIRTDGRLRHVTIGHRLHVSLMALLLFAAIWTVYATVQFIHHTGAMAAKDQQIDANRHAYRGLLTDVAAYQERFFTIARELEDNQQLMLNLVDQSASLQRSLSSSRASSTGADGGRGSEAEARERLQNELKQVEGRLAEVVDDNARLHERLTTAQIDLAGLLEIGERVAQTQLAASRHVELMEQQVSGMRDHLRTALEEREAVLSQSNSQSRHIAMLEEQLMRTQVAQQDAPTSCTSRPLLTNKTPMVCGPVYWPHSANATAPCSINGAWTTVYIF